MEIYVIINLEDGSGKPEKVFNTLQKAKDYLIKEGYSERKEIPLCFYYNPDKDKQEQDTLKEYDMVIYEEILE